MSTPESHRYRVEFPYLERAETARAKLSKWYRDLHPRTALVLVLLLIVSVLALLVLSVFVFPSLLVTAPITDGLEPTEVNSAQDSYDATKNAVRGTLIQAIGGTLIFVTAAVAWRQVQVTRQGQVTDRFTRAIDQLGSEREETRLGGIYGLQQIAANKVYSAPISEILAAYLRTSSEGEEYANSPAKKRRRGVRMSGTERERRVPTDVEAALRVLLVGNLWDETDISQLDLSFIAIPYAELMGVGLANCTLRGADLSFANLVDARFSGADLRGASFLGARLDGADLTGAKIDGASFRGALLSGTNLQSIRAERCDFSDATLVDNNIEFGDFKDADFDRSKLHGLRGSHVTFDGATFEGATIRRLDLKSVEVDERTELEAADLDDVSANALGIRELGDSDHSR